MDDGGQRLLDVIEDTHVLENFLRESFNSGLEDSPRFDNVSSSTDSGLDSLVFDGQLVDPHRGNPSLAPLSHHTHPHHSSHVLHQVLHSSHPQTAQNQSAHSVGATAHSLHPHHPIHSHHQPHHLQHQSAILHQHHVSHPHPSAPLTSDGDCLSRGTRDDPHALHQFMANAVAAGAPLHQGQHQLIPQVPHHSIQLQHHAQAQQHSSHLLPAAPLPLANTTSLLNSTHHLHQQRQHHHSSSKSQLHSHHPIPSHSQASDISHPEPSPAHSLPASLSLPSRYIPLQSSALQHQQPVSHSSSEAKVAHTSTSSSKAKVHSSHPVISHTSVATTIPLPVVHRETTSTSATTTQVGPTVTSSQTAAHSSHSQIHGSNRVLVPPPSQILPQFLQASQVLSGASILAGGIPTSSHVIPGGIIPHLINNSIAAAGVASTNAPFYVSQPTSANQTQASILQTHLSSVQSLHTMTLSSATATTNPTFTVPTRSPHTSLPRVSPSLQQTPSPASSFPNRSPAPSPQSMKSPNPPAPPPSPASSSSVVQTNSTHSPHINMLPHTMVPMVPQITLPQLTGGNGMVINQAGLKQVVNAGPLIQLINSGQQNQVRQPVIQQPKPIQPKQLLPKPSHQILNRQPTPPPPGKTLVSSVRQHQQVANSQPSLVLGSTSQAHTMIANPQTMGGFVLNSSLLGGLQQPILIPQPNGMQLLVRPTGSQGTTQTLLVSMPGGQPQVVTSMGKVNHQPQTLVIPGSGQSPAAFVIPQGLTSTLGAGGLFGAAQNARSSQPILRLVAPQAPLQLQQIQTPNGPTFIAVPMNQQALNLPGVFAAPNTVRALAPQLTQQQIQQLTQQISSGGALQLTSTSLPSTNLNALLQQPMSAQAISAAPLLNLKQHVKVSEEAAMVIQPVKSSTLSAGIGSSQSFDPKVQHKKKSKKKKKEKESPDDGKSKGGKGISSINLNELLKETGIVSEMMFDENTFLEAESSSSAVTTQQEVTSSISTAISSSVSAPVSVNVIVSTPISSVVNSTVGLVNTLSGPISTSAPTGINASGLSFPAGYCLTIDGQGKLVMSPSDVAKHINPVPTCIPQVLSSLPIQMLNQNALSINNTGTFVLAPDGNIIQSGVSAAPSSIPHFLPLAPNNSIRDAGTPATYFKIDGLTPPVVTTKSISPSKKSTEMIKVAQNTHKLNSLQPEIKAHSLLGAPHINSFLNTNPLTHGLTNGGDSLTTVHLVTNEKLLTPLKNQESSLTTSQDNHTSAIFNSSNKALVSHGAIKSKFGAVAHDKSNSHIQVHVSSNYNVNIGKSDPNPISMNIVDSTAKSNGYDGQYLSGVKTHPIIELPLNKKRSKKKKREKDFDSSPNITMDKVSTSNSLPNTYSNKSNSSLQSRLSSNPVQVTSPILLPNINKFNSKEVYTNVKSASKIDLQNQSPSSHRSLSMPSFAALTSTPSTTASLVSGISTLPSFTHTPATQLSLVGTDANTVLSTNGGIKMVTAGSGIPQTSSGFTLSGQQVVLQPGQQVKQLLLSPENQEALKRVHSQIQAVQTKRVHEQDKSLHQKLIMEYKRIMATGRPVPVTAASLAQVHIAQPSSQPIKYSHTVGHKKILFTPSQKKNYSQTINHHSTKDALKNCEFSKSIGADYSKKNADVKVKENHTMSSIISPSSSSLLKNSTSGHLSNASYSKTTTTVTATATTTITPTSVIAVSSRQSNVIVSCNISPSHSRQHPLSLNRPSPSETLRVHIPTCSPHKANYSHMPHISPRHSTTTNHSRSHSISKSANSPIISSKISEHHSSSSKESSKMLSPSVPLTITTVASISPNKTPGISPSKGTEVSTSTIPFSLPLTRDQLFEHQLRTDQNGAINPDYKTPFKTKIDACKRLIRYHVYSEPGPSASELNEADLHCDIQAENLLKKFSIMTFKYQSLLVKDSLRRHPSSETAMLYRMFIQEEKNNIERDKTDVKSGKELYLPPPPIHWLPGSTSLPSPPPFPWEATWKDEKKYELGSNGRLYPIGKAGASSCDEECAMRPVEPFTESISDDYASSFQSIIDKRKQDRLARKRKYAAAAVMSEANCFSDDSSVDSQVLIRRVGLEVSDDERRFSREEENELDEPRLQILEEDEKKRYSSSDRGASSTDEPLKKIKRTSSEYYSNCDRIDNVQNVYKVKVSSNEYSWLSGSGNAYDRICGSLGPKIHNGKYDNHRTKLLDAGRRWDVVEKDREYLEGTNHRERKVRTESQISKDMFSKKENRLEDNNKSINIFSTNNCGDQLSELKNCVNGDGDSGLSDYYYDSYKQRNSDDKYKDSSFKKSANPKKSKRDREKRKRDKTRREDGSRRRDRSRERSGSDRPSKKNRYKNKLLSIEGDPSTPASSMDSDVSLERVSYQTDSPLADQDLSIPPLRVKSETGTLKLTLKKRGSDYYRVGEGRISESSKEISKNSVRNVSVMLTDCLNDNEPTQPSPITNDVRRRDSTSSRKSRKLKEELSPYGIQRERSGSAPILTSPWSVQPNSKERWSDCPSSNPPKPKNLFYSQPPNSRWPITPPTNHNRYS